MKNILPILAFALALTFCNCGGESDDEPVKPTPVQPEPTPTPEPTQPEEKPDEKPDDTHDKYSIEATKLLNYLKGIYGKKMLSGTMACVNWNTNEAQWVYKHTGRWPAMNCFDFIHHVFSQPGGWIDYSNTSVVEDWYRKGGIVAAMWHWNVPAKKSGEYAFYAADTDFDVTKVFDESSAEYALMVRDIDKIANYLKPLRDKGIPVLWRPLHEAGGQWFWWGRDAQACKRLWQLMKERFDAAGLNNLIWMWTHSVAWGKPFSDGMNWYPGDEYVDIVGFDLYNISDVGACYNDYFLWLQQQCPDKLVAITECGNIPAISSQWEAGAKWLMFMPWYDYDRTNNTSAAAFSSKAHSNASIEWWQDAWKQDYVLSRDQVEMP